MIEAWIFWSWLCAGPGPAGECHPLPDRTPDSRAACLQASRAARQADARIVVHRWQATGLTEPCRTDGAAGDLQGESQSAGRDRSAF